MSEMKRRCPLAGASMTKGAMDRYCAVKKAEAQYTEDLAKNRKSVANGYTIGFILPCLTCTGPPPDLRIIDVEKYKQSVTEEKIMSETNNTIGDLNKKLFAQLDRLTNDNLAGDALNVEINRAKAVTEIAGQIINAGSLALKAKLAFKDRGGSGGGNIPKMLEG